MPTISYEWIQTADLTRFQPITQVYGICFNNAGEILIIKKPDGNQWKIPGGRPEPGESFEETLRRELMEEATVSVKNCRPLGVQKVIYPQNPNRIQGDQFYQARYVCEIADVLPITVDPDNGLLHDRKFVPMEDVTSWVKWDKHGAQMFADAIEMKKSV
ncbi:NUDIX hydrolase [bacterium]|nr:NUDIX hydrolase [bacterium]